MSFHQNSARRKALSDFPPSLAEFYLERISRRVKQSTDLKIATTALSWVLSCTRPLKLVELFFATSIDTEEEMWSEDQLFDDPESVVDICGGLITIREAEEMDVCPVLFCHPSVADFLNCQFLPNGSTNPYFVEAQERDKGIIKACLIYLKSRLLAHGPIESPDDMEQRTSDDPFFSCAASEWAYHFCPGMEKEEDLQSLIQFALGPENGKYFASSQSDLVVKFGDESLRRYVPNADLEVPEPVEKEP
jgi:hypothetical protein